METVVKPNPTVFDEWGYRAVAWFRRRKFERAVNRILTHTQGHVENKVIAGDPKYQLLADKAGQVVKEFCRQEGVPIIYVEAQIPALGKLYELANPASVPSVVQKTGKRYGSKFVAFALMSGLVTFIGGILAGIAYQGFHLVTR